jgi:hypothetical protein
LWLVGGEVIRGAHPQPNWFEMFLPDDEIGV